MDDSDVPPSCVIAECDRPGVHYFGEVELPKVDTGEYVDAGETDFDFVDDDEQFDVVEWSGEYRTIEYVECDHHFYDRDEEPEGYERRSDTAEDSNDQ